MASRIVCDQAWPCVPSPPLAVGRVWPPERIEITGGRVWHSWRCFFFVLIYFAVLEWDNVRQCDKKVKHNMCNSVMCLIRGIYRPSPITQCNLIQLLHLSPACILYITARHSGVTSFHSAIHTGFSPICIACYGAMKLLRSLRIIMHRSRRHSENKRTTCFKPFYNFLVPIYNFLVSLLSGISYLESLTQLGI
jgi:hypothetical protein